MYLNIYLYIDIYMCVYIFNFIYTYYYVALKSMRYSSSSLSIACVIIIVGVVTVRPT